MEQIKVDFTRDKVAYVRSASQLKFSKEPMTIGYLVDNKFNVRYAISDNRIQAIIYDMAEMPNKETFDIMQKYLSIDNIDHVTIAIPVDKMIQVWRWADLSKRILDAEKEKEKVSNDIIEPKEVLKDGKSKKNNIQNKPRRNTVVDMNCNDTTCKHRTKDGHCRLSSPIIVDEKCRSYIKREVGNKIVKCETCKHREKDMCFYYKVKHGQIDSTSCLNYSSIM